MLTSRKAILSSFLLVALAIAGGAAFILSTREPASKQDEPSGKEQAKPLQLDADALRRAGIQVQQIDRTDFAETLTAFGTIGPNRNSFARVASPIAGRVAKIAVDLGAAINGDAPLAVLESPELADIRTTYQQNQTELELARTNLDRSQKLSVDASIAQKDLLRARADFERARVGLAAIEARLVSLAVPATYAAGTSPALLTVSAPFTGTVVERTAVQGEYVQAYQALFTVADLSTVWVEANLYDRDLAEVIVGAPATVSVGAYPDQRFTGKITYIGNILDKDTRTVVARIEVANADAKLKPGLFATVDIEKAAHRNALRVPEAALILVQGQTTAFVEIDGGFVPRPVEIGERNGGKVIVTAGLEPGDRVVTAGAFALKARLLKSQLSAGE